MTIWSFGSINADHVYLVPHIPGPGETIAAVSMKIGLGGKGCNQSVAAARAGARVEHIGAVGSGSDWILDRLNDFGVGTGHIQISDLPTGHAIISVAEDGENAITILAGANHALSASDLEAALSNASAGDSLVLQNETNLQVEAAQIAKAKGMRVFYSAAPFDAQATEAVLPFIDVLLLNEIEAQQLEESVGCEIAAMEVDRIVITLGARGARWIDTDAGTSFDVPGEKVRAQDTTGAGDTFAGYLIAALSQGLEPKNAMALAGKAAALKVTRRGAADAIPSRSEVDQFKP